MAPTLERVPCDGSRFRELASGLCLWRALAARRDVRAAASSAVGRPSDPRCLRAGRGPPVECGRGEVFTRAGTREMDAAVMRGRAPCRGRSAILGYELKGRAGFEEVGSATFSHGKTTSGRGGGAAQSGNGIEQSARVSTATVPSSFRSSLARAWQGRFVDLVFPEYRFLLFESEPSQPIRSHHRRRSFSGDISVQLMSSRKSQVLPLNRNSRNFFIG